MHARVARLTALGLMLSVFACRDSVAPGKHAASASGSSEVVESGFAVRVSPDSSRGWMFFDDQHGAACLEADNCHIARDTSALHFAETSIELATPTAADGDVLMLPAYRGVRLDRITELRYSTYRESPDSGDRLAVMLQLNVDYDLGDAYTAYEGRIVFEPAQGQRGAVPMGQWQRWDTRAGRWWGTKTVVRLGGVETLGVCTKASPCSWSQLLATYPNIGIHAANGAIVLQAGANWPGFRGNADSLAVGVNGVVTTYDFGRVFPVSEPPHLYARIGDGVLSATPLAEDTAYTLGSRVAYSFAARPGHQGPYVIVDDTMAATSGVIAMDRTHSIEVVSDTLYTVDGLSDDGKHIAQQIRALLTTSDKVEAYREMINFIVDRLAAGANEAELTRASELAWYLTVDPLRDQVALRDMTEQLNGKVFSMSSGDSYVSTGTVGQIPPGVAPSLAPSAATRGAAGAPMANGPERTVATPDQLRSPREPTRIVYINGWDNYQSDAAATSAKLRQLVFTQERFNNGSTKVDYVYNASFNAQLAEYDRAHPCVTAAVRDLSVYSKTTVNFMYALCSKTALVNALTTFELTAAISARLELLLRLEPSSDDVDSLATYIAKHRSSMESRDHIIVVGHSEGTIVIPQTLRVLPALEQHNLNDAPACLATLALAPAASAGSYDLEGPFKSAITVAGDVVLVVPGVDGWPEPLYTESTARAEEAIRKDAWKGSSVASYLYQRAVEAVGLHSVNKTYLTDPLLRQEILNRLADLHRECLQGELTVTPNVVTAAPGTTFILNAKLLNQNGRQLHGRWAMNSFVGTWSPHEWENIEVTALVPRDEPQLYYYSSSYLQEQVSLTIPTGMITGTTITEGYSSYWEFYAASNGGLGDPPFGYEDKAPAPTDDPWMGGDPSTCEKYFRAEGRSGWAGPSWGMWVRRCDRSYTVTPGTVANKTIAAQVLAFRWRWTYADGGVTAAQQEPTVWCHGPERCIASVTVWGYDANNYNIVTSGPVAADVGGSGPSPTAPLATGEVRSGRRPDAVRARARRPSARTARPSASP